LPVRFYEIMNEPWFYFGWDSSKPQKLASYVELWNTVARRMRQENPNLMISHCASTIKWVLNYWILHGDDLDFLAFHKYDSDVYGQSSDAQMFSLAEQRQFEVMSSSSYYGAAEARQKWFNARGKTLPVINSESNFNSAYSPGTDSRLQQMAGSVWLALVLRQSILKGLIGSVYYTFSSGLIGRTKPGYGFGMINSDNNRPWYPYYVQKMISPNLRVGDEICESASSSQDVRVLSWKHEGKLNILVISKSNQTSIMHLQGVSGTFNVQKIDNSIPFDNPSIQYEIFSQSGVFPLEGYTVAVLQKTIAS